MHIGKKVWRSYGDSRSQSSTELNVNKFIIIIKPDRKKTCEIDAGAWMEEEKQDNIVCLSSRYPIIPQYEKRGAM